MPIATQSGIEQCPPAAAWPEPAARNGGSWRRSMGADWCQSQAPKASSTAQNTRRKVKVVFMAAQNLKWRRTRRPTSVPAKASGTQIQPWMLPVEMPLNMAPTLQPKARREL